MPGVLNLAFLRNITSGNHALEAKLFHLYDATVETCFAEMTEGMTPGADGKWRDAVHQLKGASANIGAEEMRALCTEAECLEEKDAEKKKEYLASMRQAYERLGRAMREAVG